MSFISIYYVIFVAFLNLVFYTVPVRYRIRVILAGSLFYVFLYSKGAALWLIAALLVTFGYGRTLGKKEKGKGRGAGLGAVIVLLLFPLVFFKGAVFWNGGRSLFVPVGISFYTLSLISYAVDIYRKKYEPEENLMSFMVFSIFFPQIVQGPIARFDKWKKNLEAERSFDYKEFTFGWQLVLWGYFLKFVVADKAGIMVNTVYGNYTKLQGLYIAVAAVLYSIQLYADFCGCVNIALGTAQTFGFWLSPNFRQPYFALSIRDFWRRWHMTLSGWLRDYIYIPLGGSRKGTVRQCINILIVFGVSGLWHGAGLTFLVWGIFHGICQVAEVAVSKRKKEQKEKKPGILGMGVRMGITFLLVTFAWMIFRADSLTHFAGLIKNMFAIWNPEVILDGDAYYKMGLSRLQTVPLVLGIVSLFGADFLHEKNISLREWTARRPLIIRWIIYLAMIMTVLVFGTYGPAYLTNQFIYGRF